MLHMILKVHNWFLSSYHRYVIEFEVAANINVTEGEDSYNAALDKEENLMDALEVFVDETEMDLTVDNGTLQADKSSLYVDFIKAECGVGHSANNKLYYCGEICFSK